MRVLPAVVMPGGVPVRNVVHPIDKAKHPTWAGHFRWCVQIGDDPCNEELMLQAGVAESAAAATRDGDMCAAAVINGFRVAGVPVDWRASPVLIEDDPLPPDEV